MDKYRINQLQNMSKQQLASHKAYASTRVAALEHQLKKTGEHSHARREVEVAIQKWREVRAECMKKLEAPDGKANR